jgi:hypothetical protein
MKGRRPPFWNSDTQIRRATQASIARKKRLAAALIPPEPPPSPADAPQPAAEAMPVGRTVGMTEAGYHSYRAARRVALYHQPSQRLPLLSWGVQDPPTTTSTLTEPAAGQWQGEQALPTTTASAALPTVPPSGADTAGASPPDPGATFGGAGAFHADATVVRPSEPDRGAGNPAVQTAILPLFKLDAERQELLSPLPAIEPHKQKKDARGRPARPRSKSTTRAQTKQSATINRVEVIRQTKALIIALEEALD